MIRMVIFDCDGVLIDSEPVGTATMAADLATRGLDITPDGCAGLFTRGTMQSAGEEAAKRGATIPDNWVEVINAKIAAELADGVPELPGLRDLLAAIDAQGIATAVASNGPQSKMRASLAPSGLDRYFAGRIHSGHDDGKPKPDPHMLLKAARIAGVEPSACIMIDDHLSGIGAAQAAGMTAIGLAADGDVARLSGSGAQIITHLTKVIPMLG